MRTDPNSPQADPRSVARALCERLDGALRFDDADRSFSPHFSNVGLGFVAPPPGTGPAAGSGGPEAAGSRSAGGRELAGIATAYLHVNRVTRALGRPFLTLAGEPPITTCHAPLEVRQTFSDGGELRVVGSDVDTFVLRGQGERVARLAVLDDPDLLDLRPLRAGARERRWLARLPTLDPRDPDPAFPIVLAARLAHGRWLDDRTLAPDADGRLELAVALQLIEIDEASLDERLGRAVRGADDALERSLEWLATALGPYQSAALSEPEARLEARAVYALLANTCAAPGLMRSRLASFPSRGGYPVHFLWDSCFQALGLEAMTPRLASDALEILIDTARPDGKIAHFVASTWTRPGASQPPLLGWAVGRLSGARNAFALSQRVLGVLDANNRWWIAQRGTRFGLLRCDDPFETGWDDTPRLDHGPVLALDMNSYLLAQLRVTAALAERLGDDTLERANRERAAALDAAILRTLFDEDRGMFLDADAETGERRALLTPAALLPLWAGVSLPRRRAAAIVRDTLLDPARLFGPVPFPSVAYDEPSYEPGNWWRGPTWPPIAVLMLELLERLGFDAEASAARDRLLAVLLADGELHELFDSRSGTGLGQREQGWTAACYLWLLRRRGAPNDS